MRFEMIQRLLGRYVWFISAIAVFLFAWSNQSLWIDECCMVLGAMQDSFADVWHKVEDVGGSDMQMAWYLYLLHLWIRFTGADTELMLRLFNIVWVVLACWFLRKEPKILFVLIISPFFIYYINELRPYAMQVAAACGITMFLYKLSQGEKQNYVVGFGLLFLLCLTSLTSVIWAIGFLVAWGILAGREFFSKKLIKAIACWLVPFAVLGAYYLYTLLIGARAAHIKSSIIVNLGASVYELLGLTGLGPSRSELRLCYQMSDVLSDGRLLLPFLAMLVIALVLVWGLIAWKRSASHSLLPALIALAFIPLSIFIYISITMDFRFLARHLAPLFPVICIAVSKGLIWSEKRPFQTIVSVALVSLWVASDVSVRFNEAHAREDYRGAVKYCKEKNNRGENVLLLCNYYGKEYYGWSDSFAPAQWAQCQSIVVSRPADFSPIIKQIESAGDYQKRKLGPAFWVYEK